MHPTFDRLARPSPDPMGCARRPAKQTYRPAYVVLRGFAASIHAAILYNKMRGCNFLLYLMLQ